VSGAVVAMHGGVVGCPLRIVRLCACGRAGSQLQQYASSGPDSTVGWWAEELGKGPKVGEKVQGGCKCANVQFYNGQEISAGG
jgi:hypothetical protein